MFPPCTLKRLAQKDSKRKQIWGRQSSPADRSPLQGSPTLPVCPQTDELEDDSQN